jgi:hypothetical protein
MEMFVGMIAIHPPLKIALFDVGRAQVLFELPANLLEIRLKKVNFCGSSLKSRRSANPSDKV